MNQGKISIRLDLALKVVDVSLSLSFFLSRKCSEKSEDRAYANWGNFNQAVTVIDTMKVEA